MYFLFLQPQRAPEAPGKKPDLGHTPAPPPAPPKESLSNVDTDNILADEITWHLSLTSQGYGEGEGLQRESGLPCTDSWGRKTGTLALRIPCLLLLIENAKKCKKVLLWRNTEALVRNTCDAVFYLTALKIYLYGVILSNISLRKLFNMSKWFKLIIPSIILQYRNAYLKLVQNCFLIYKLELRVLIQRHLPIFRLVDTTGSGWLDGARHFRRQLPWRRGWAHLWVWIPEVGLDLIHSVCSVRHGPQVQPLKHHLVLGEGSCDKDHRGSSSTGPGHPIPDTTSMGRGAPRQWERSAL